MPAPKYYHWSQEQPCTTNQNYGFLLKDDLKARQKFDLTQPKKAVGPFEYTRPFSNMGFFPEIVYKDPPNPKNALNLPQVDRFTKKTSECFVPPPSLNKFNINDGYTMGPVPITSRMMTPVPGQPLGFKLLRSSSAPPAIYQEVARPKAKDLYLWHSLSGCLVHVDNHKKPTRSSLSLPKRSKTQYDF